MDQQHVFHGFQCGEKEQCSLLSDQIVGVNSRLLQDALQSLEQPSKRQVNVTTITSKVFSPHRVGSTTRIKQCCCVLFKTNCLAKPLIIIFWSTHTSNYLVILI